MKKRALQLLVAAGCLAVAILLRGRTSRPETPEAVVNALFDAAGRGDDRAYLELVAGDCKRSLLETRAELGPEAFRRHLQQSAAGIKGLAITRRDSVEPGQVTLEIEIVFAERNERQRLRLAPRGPGWVVVSLDAARSYTPAIPYGTSITDE